jgi:hypothetical protein
VEDILITFFNKEAEGTLQEVSIKTEVTPTASYGLFKRPPCSSDLKMLASASEGTT